MKMNKSIIWSLVLLIITAAIYRVIPNRPYGFAPHLAMALFAGAIIKDKKWAFALPIFSIFLSDLLYEALYSYGLTELPGFYEGQFTNYVIFTGLTCIGFLLKRITPFSILGYSIVTATVYFLISNLMVWINGGGYARPRSLSGLLQCFTDGLPFYRGSLEATVIFSMILFGGYYLLQKSTLPVKAVV